MIGIYSSSMSRFVFEILRFHNEFLDDLDEFFTSLYVWGQVMRYTHVNAQFQIISIR